MFPTQRAAGIAGVLAGVGLLVEGAFWTISGWTPQTWDVPSTALDFLAESGTMLRVGVFVGALNLVFAVLLIAGLADRLRHAAPTAAAGSLYFGIIGVAAHGLVPIGLWLGVPMFLNLAAHDESSAEGSWGAFAVFIAAAGGLGSLFAGLSTLAVGWAGLTKKVLPALLSWLAVIVGVATALTVLAAHTPLAALAGAAYLPSLVLAIVFRIWAGVHLLRSTGPAGVAETGRARGAAASRVGGTPARPLG